MPAKPEISTATNQELWLRGYAYIDWESQGLHFSLVGDVALEPLRQIAKSLHAIQLLTYLQDLPSTAIERHGLEPGPNNRKSNA